MSFLEQLPIAHFIILTSSSKKDFSGSIVNWDSKGLLMIYVHEPSIVNINKTMFLST